MIQFLSLGDHGHPTADLIVKNDLGDTLSVFDGNLLERRFSKIVDLVSQRLFLVFTPAQERAVGNHNNLHLLAQVVQVLLE